MFITIQDANGDKRTVIMNGPGPATDMSGVILVTDEEQQVAPPNANRSGWFFQNKGNNVMLLNDLGDAADGIKIGPGESWPAPNYPPSPSAILVAGAEGDAFIYREW